MIYAVFSDEGNFRQLASVFYKTLNLAYKTYTSEAVALLSSRGIEDFYCEDPTLDYIRVESFHTQAAFDSRMLLIYNQYLEANKEYPALCEKVQGIVTKMQNGVASPDEIRDNYNKVIVEADDLSVFYSLEDLLEFMYKI